MNSDKSAIKTWGVVLPGVKCGDIPRGQLPRLVERIHIEMHDILFENRLAVPPQPKNYFHIYNDIFVDGNFCSRNFGFLFFLNLFTALIN